MLYRMVSLSGSPQLGTTKRSSSSILNTDERIEASQFARAILERETSAHVGVGLTCASCVAVISGRLVQSLL